MAIKRTLKQLIEKHEKDAKYARAKAEEFARRADASLAKAQRLKEEAAEAAS